MARHHINEKIPNFTKENKIKDYIAGNTCSRPDEKGMGQNFEVLKPERHP